MMTNRERVLAILDGRSPDRIPWMPRLKLWYDARVAEGNMPSRYRSLSLRECERAIGAGTPARRARVFRVRREGVEVREKLENGQLHRQYIPPMGTVSELRVRSGEMSHQVEDYLLVEPLIKRAEDYSVLEYVYEHTYFEPTHEEYLAFERDIGDDGYPMVSAGDCPFHYFLLHLAGYNNAYFELADHLPQVEHLLAVMEQVELERLWPVVYGSPARLILHGAHFDSQMTPPHLFRRYITPYYQKATPTLRKLGKCLAYHADADAKLILTDIKEAGFGMAECFAAAPMVSVTLEEARQAWGADVIIFGGVPSVVLEDSTMSDDEFEEYMVGVFKAIAPGDAVILGVGDNVMPTARIERVERISQMVERWGRYPITID